MSDTFDDNESTIFSILFPENILINDSIGIIEVNEEQKEDGSNILTNQFNRFYYDDQYSLTDNNNEIFLSSMEKFNYTYLANNKKNTILSSHIKEGYNEKILNELSSNIKNENGYAVYYENPINLSVSSNFIQVNDNIYTINKNLFTIQNNSYLNNDHILNKKYQKIYFRRFNN